MPAPLRKVAGRSWPLSLFVLGSSRIGACLRFRKRDWQEILIYQSTLPLDF
jgi:hypothetical protein